MLATFSLHSFQFLKSPSFRLDAGRFTELFFFFHKPAEYLFVLATLYENAPISDSRTTSPHRIHRQLRARI
jgi:hypothetical protein